MSEKYIRNHFDDIINYSKIIEDRRENNCSIEGVVLDNKRVLELIKKHKIKCILIDKEYKIEIE